MDVLVVNCGSSSVKAAVVDAGTGAQRGEKIERIGRGGPEDHVAALRSLLPRLGAEGIRVVGHRVVHGGERFTAPTRIDDDVVAAIEALADLAPLHNPPAVVGIRAARALLPDAVHVAVFDTAFHATLPKRARTYALPVELAERHGIRRFGFHGTSHAYVSGRAAEHLGEAVEDLRVVSCHLGNGASVAAVEYGRSVETSMGMTPLEGLVMGTRAGDVDPGVLIALMRREGLDADGLDRLLNEESGLAALSGVGNDLRDIEERAGQGDARAQLALHVFCHRVRKYVGAYAAVMGGLDAIVFTAGIGENSALVRHHVASRLEFLGARLDEDANRGARAGRGEVLDVSQEHSRVRILVVGTDEEHEIARQAVQLASRPPRLVGDRGIPVAISARHVHLTQQAVETLFGPGATLTPKRELSQPGQFAAEERVALVGPRRTLEDVVVVGPVRSKNQVEVSRTDEFFLGIDAPIRCSGDLAGSPGLTLRGPAGEVVLTEGVICSQRHLHMAPADAAFFGVRDRQAVEVALDTEGRDLVFGDVVVRVDESYALELHLDTDEGNAAELTKGATGVLALTRGSARLRAV